MADEEKDLRAKEMKATNNGLCYKRESSAVTLTKAIVSACLHLLVFSQRGETSIRNGDNSERSIKSKSLKRELFELVGGRQAEIFCSHLDLETN